MEKGSFFFSRMMIAHTTLTACAKTVASCAGGIQIESPATRNKSPKIFTIQATRTNKSGDLLSPSPRKIAASLGVIGNNEEDAASTDSYIACGK